MKKKKLCKKIAGICLVAMMAVAGVGKYAKAGTFSVPGAWGGCSAEKVRGTAYTVVGTEWNSYGSVSATFSCYSGGACLFSHGDGAGGVHGASVSIFFNGDEKSVTYSSIMATHIAVVENVKYERSTSDSMN